MFQLQIYFSVLVKYENSVSTPFLTRVVDCHLSHPCLRAEIESGTVTTLLDERPDTQHLPSALSPAELRAQRERARLTPGELAAAAGAHSDRISGSSLAIRLISFVSATHTKYKRTM